MAFGADLIAGFPTETNEHFSRSLDLVEDCELAFLHVFPYSRRAGTPAARMPQIDRRLVRERAARLRLAGGAALDRHLDAMAQAGGADQMLVENSGLARTRNFTPVDIPGAPLGHIVSARITGRSADRLSGELTTPASGLIGERNGTVHGF